MFLIPDLWYTIKTTRKKGRGVFAAHDIEAGTIIGDYLGTIIRCNKSDEKKNGLYDMAGGLKYDILADPQKKGIQLINHSCANNCGIYPHQGHMLYFALRKIFKNEEVTVDYGLFAPDDTTITCNLRVCHCGSEICTGTMHSATRNFDSWERLVKKEFGRWYKKVPGKYGSELMPLQEYPSSIQQDRVKIYEYDLFGSEIKIAEKYNDRTLPTMFELRRRIRKTGRQLSLPRIQMIIYGIRGEMLLVKRINS